MKKMGIFILIGILLCYSCKQNSDTKVKQEISQNDSSTFFQVGHYIQSQIDEVNKTAYFIYKIEVNNNIKDSTPINNAIFNGLSSQFLQPDINNPSIKKNYIENIFHDQTTESYTISYSTTNPDLPLQNMEILLQEDGETVKRIFIRKLFNYTDSTAIEQLSWKSGERFQINRLVTMPDKSEIERRTIVVWNEKS